MKKITGILIILQFSFLPICSTQTLVNDGGLLTVKNGSTLSIKGDYYNLDDGNIVNPGDIDISGDWINNATSGNLLQGTTGNVHFNGISPQIIGGTTRTWFGGIHVQSDIALNVETSVSKGLLLSGASLDINGQFLIMQTGSFLLGANSTNYIIAEENGRLFREVESSDILFPVGTISSYVPVTLNNAGTTDFFGVNVFDDVLDGGTSGSSISEIDNCVNITWDIIELIPGSSDVSIKTQWNPSDEGSSFDRTHCGIGHYQGGTWDPQADGVASGTNPYSITRSGITNLSVFAVGDINSPMAFVLDLVVDVTAFLEGPFKATFMAPDLNPEYIPLTQPFNTSPWDYPGIESVGAIPNVAVIDWVLVEIRDAANAASATPATKIAQQAAFVLANGKIVGMDGTSDLDFNETINQNLFVVVWHRNHLAVMSAFPLSMSGGVYSYNFTTGESQAYGGILGHKEIGSGVWGMVAGDGDASGEITADDKSSWVLQTGKAGYLMNDYSMNGQVNNQDKNDFGIQNTGEQSRVPDYTK